MLQYGSLYVGNRRKENHIPSRTTNPTVRATGISNSTKSKVCTPSKKHRLQSTQRYPVIETCSTWRWGKPPEKLPEKKLVNSGSKWRDSCVPVRWWFWCWVRVANRWRKIRTTTRPTCPTSQMVFNSRLRRPMYMDLLQARVPFRKWNGCGTSTITWNGTRSWTSLRTKCVAPISRPTLRISKMGLPGRPKVSKNFLSPEHILKHTYETNYISNTSRISSTRKPDLRVM